MADLDDFFAKKDRKKSKGKKFTTTEEIAKKLEETGKKVEKPKIDKPKIQTQLTGQEGEDLSGNIPEEEEWKDFEEEKKDYTGLKIQNLMIQDLNEVENNDGEGEDDMEENEQGELVPKKKGPWKMIDSANADGFPVAQKPVQVPVQAPVNTGEQQRANEKTSYVPPFLRNQQLQQLRERPTRAKTGAPDITNQDYFPTLSAASNESPASWGRRKQEAQFEEVRNSRSHSNRLDSSRLPQGLQIGNKFGALESEHS